MAKQFQYDWLREEIVFAHAEPYRPGRSTTAPPAVQIETARTRRALRHEEVDGLRVPVNPDTTHLIHAVETVSPRRDYLPLPDNAFQATRLVRLCRELPEPLRAFVRVVYVPRGGDVLSEQAYAADRRAVLSHAWAQFSAVRCRVRPGSVERLRRMTVLAFGEYVASATRGDAVRLTHAQIAERLGVPMSNWDRSWAPRWRALLGIFQRLDTEALETLLADLRRPRHAA